MVAVSPRNTFRRPDSVLAVESVRKRLPGFLCFLLRGLSYRVLIDRDRLRLAVFCRGKPVPGIGPFGIVRCPYRASGAFRLFQKVKPSLRADGIRAALLKRAANRLIHQQITANRVFVNSDLYALAVLAGTIAAVFVAAKRIAVGKKLGVPDVLQLVGIAFSEFCPDSV